MLRKPRQYWGLIICAAHKKAPVFCTGAESIPYEGMEEETLAA